MTNKQRRRRVTQYKRAILYARYSPRPKDNDSVAAQARDMQDWCQKNGIPIHMVAFDPDVSGTVPLFDRPGLASALSVLRRSDILVLRNLKRAARSLLVGLAIEEEVERIGARIAFTEEGGVQPTKGEDLNAWCMRAILYLMADMDRIGICKRTSAGMLRHQREGRAMGSQAPYGWATVDGQHVPLEEEQPRLAMIKVWAKEDLTPYEIARRLNVAGIPARGKRWHPNTVARILWRIEKGANPSLPQAD